MLRIHAHADGEGGCQARGAHDLVDILQDAELVGHDLIHIPLLEDEEEAALVQLAQQAVVAFGPFGDRVVEPGIEAGDRALGQVLGHLIVVIHQHDADHGTGADIFVTDLIQFRKIAEVQDAEQRAPVILGTDQGAVDPVTAAVQGHIVARLIMAGGEPFGGEAGEDILQLMVHHGLADTGEPAEALIGPDDAAVAQAHQHRGEGALALAHALQGIGHALDILAQLLVPVVLGHGEDQEHQQREHDLSRRQPVFAHVQRRGAEDHQHCEIEAHIRPQKLSKPSLHPVRPPFSAQMRIRSP